MNSSRLAMWAFVGFLLLISAAVDSKTQGTVASAGGQGTNIKSEVQLVLIDVVVTSGNGRPVGGLPKDKFQITEDGQPQAIAAFEGHKDVPAARIPLPPMPPKVFTNYPTTRKTDSVNVFLLDALNTQNPDQAFVRGQMTNYLHEAAASPSGARFAVFTLGSRLRIDRQASNYQKVVPKC